MSVRVTISGWVDVEDQEEVQKMADDVKKILEKYSLGPVHYGSNLHVEDGHD